MTPRTTLPFVSRWAYRRGLSILALLALALPLSAAPRDELIRLVPDDVGFCLVLQDLRVHIATLRDSPLLEQVRKSAAGKAFLESDEFRKLVTAEEELKKHLGVSGEQLRDDIFGDAIVLAYRPSPDGKPEGEQGIFLLHARNAKLLADLIERVNNAQKQSGELKELEARKHQGVTYYLRVEDKGTHYYYLNGATLALTSQEPLLKQVIELEGRERKLESTLGQRMRQLGVHQAMLTWWINPRAFDAELQRKVAQAKPAEMHGLKRVQTYWKALDGIACTFTPRKSDFELGLAVLAREADLPTPARKFLSGDNRPSELWTRFPRDAMLTVAGRVDVPALTEFIGDFLPAEEQRRLKDTVKRLRGALSNLDVEQDVLANLGPDWGFCLVAPTAKEKSPLPTLLTALRIRPGDKQQPVGKALSDVLTLLAGLAAIAYPEPLTIKSVQQDKVEVKYLDSEKGAAAGVQPAYALKDGYLLLASSPAAIPRFGPAGEVPATDDCPLLRLSFRPLRAYLTERKDVLAAGMAEKHQMKTEDAGRRLQGIIDACRYFERLELSRRTAPGQVALLLRLHTEQPLRK
jgi:hypothetical protein